MGSLSNVVGIALNGVFISRAATSDGYDALAPPSEKGKTP
jgi:hypothetical protein